MRRAGILIVAALSAGLSHAARAAEPRLAYPESEAVVAGSALARALGPAGYVLADPGEDAAFRDAVARAVARHPVFHAQESQGALARADVRAARSALYPRLSANIVGDYVIARDFGPDTDNPVDALRPSGQVNAGLSVSQLLFDGGAAAARIRSARARGREQAQTLDARINELSLSALSAHYDLAAHQAIVALGEEFIRRHEALLRDVEERERLGAGTKADVLRASARLSAAKVRVSRIRESQKIAEIRYEEMFRETPGALLRAPSFEAVAAGSRDEAVALALNHNPQIAIAGARVEATQAEYRAAKAARLPEVRANVGATRFGVLDDSDDYDVRGGVGINYDLYAGGARGAEIARSAEVARQNKFDEDRVRQEVTRDAATAFERKIAAEERLSVLAEAVVAHAGARDLVAERFRASRGDLIDLLQAENDWFESGVAYLSGRADRAMATFELMQHTGDLLRFFAPRDPETALVDGGVNDGGR